MIDYLETKNGRKIHLDDVFYTIRRKSICDFREPCKVCNDKRELTINGVTFRCPCCGNAKTAMAVYQWVVKRLRVYSFSLEKGTDYWRPSTYVTKSVGLYNKTGTGRNDRVYCGYFDENGFKIDRYTDQIDEYMNCVDIDSYIVRNEYALYDDYKLAVDVCNRLNAATQKRVDEYNKYNGTDYHFEWKYKNDEKSK